MKISLNWLLEYVAFDGTPAALADMLTMAGVEVEKIETRGVNLDKVVVAQILASEQHPNADRLSVCRVDDGSGAQPPRQIVCGAKNYQVGNKVPLALPGAVLPGDFKIKVGRIRGVESEGMLCSAKELGVTEEAAGLLILPADARIGAPIEELFPADTIFDVEITPNRPDLLSHAGLAREIAALTGQRCLWPGEAVWRALPRVKPHVEEMTVAVAPDAASACAFYSARIIVGVKVGPSPGWLRSRLESIGVRSINNVVDVTNYVMMEMGQPLHAFDAERVHPGLDPAMGVPNQTGIEVRRARSGEELLALDGRTYQLASHHLVIAEKGGRALALAGIMGGEESAVTTATRTLILESAHFSPQLIRRTSRELGLASDSSYRFERGVDLGQTDDASLRAAQLLMQLAGGEARGMYIAVGRRDVSIFPLEGREVALRPARCRQLLGVEVTDERIDEILRDFGLTKTHEDGGAWQIPTHRQDLTREVDLIEEVARVVGLDQVAGRALGKFVPASATDKFYDFTLELRRRLAALGFHEARTVSLVSDAATREVAFPSSGSAPRLKNPLTEEGVALRASLLPGLLATAGLNARLGATDLRLFEIGRVFAAASDEPRPEEQTRLALLLTGAASPCAWRGESRMIDAHDLRGILETACRQPLELRPSAPTAALPAGASLHVGDTPVGHLGLLAPTRVKALDLPGRAPVLVAELDVTALFALAGASSERKFRALPRFPSVTRDLALVVARDLPHGGIEAILRGGSEPLLTDVELFDVFSDPTGEKVPADKKSLAYSLTYRAEDRTLKAEEVAAAHARLKERLAAAFDLQFRE